MKGVRLERCEFVVAFTPCSKCKAKFDLPSCELDGSQQMKLQQRGDGRPAPFFPFNKRVLPLSTVDSSAFANAPQAPRLPVEGVAARRLDGGDVDLGHCAGRRPAALLKRRLLNGSSARAGDRSVLDCRTEDLVARRDCDGATRACGQRERSERGGGGGGAHFCRGQRRTARETRTGMPASRRECRCAADKCGACAHEGKCCARGCRS
jgi:hypothetical protein